jgi:proteic killer suppression protein
VIRSFGDDDTRRVFHREFVARFQGIQESATRKLLMLDAAHSLEDLRALRGNRLEKLKGNRAGQFSIRINDQWRICFRWLDHDAHDVEIADYH